MKVAHTLFSTDLCLLGIAPFSSVILLSHKGISAHVGLLVLHNMVVHEAIEKSVLPSDGALTVSKKEELKELDITPNENCFQDNPNSFHCAISSVIVLAQCFGLLPVQGVTGSTSELRFQWCSFRTVYSILLLVINCILMVLSVLVLAQTGVTFKQSGLVVFTGTVMVMYSLFLQLARKWQFLLNEWSTLEQSQRHYGYPAKLQLKVRLITLVMLLGALVEHALADVKGVANCRSHSLLEAMRVFLHSHYVFKFVSYSIPFAITLKTINIMATFTWNFADLFIILVSLAVSERFQLFNNHLNSIREKLLPESFWCKVRTEYNALSHLTKSLDSCISKIVLMSFASNLYFICGQLLHSLSPLSTTLDYVYRYWSFAFMLFRTVMVSLYAARINEESLLPKMVLYSVPARSYETEVPRFLFQVSTDNVALTGMNFFSVTRTLLLTLAGTIVTYEIVLVQFNSINLSGSNFTLINANNSVEDCSD